MGMAAPRRILLLLLLLLPFCGAELPTQQIFDRLYLTCHAIPRPTVFVMGKCYLYAQSENDCKSLANGNPVIFNYVSSEIQQKLGDPEKKRGFKLCEIGYRSECTGDFESPFGCYSTVISDSHKGAMQKCRDHNTHMVVVHSDWDIILLTQFAITQGLKSVALGGYRDGNAWINTDGSEYDHHRFQAAEVRGDFQLFDLKSGYFLNSVYEGDKYVCYSPIAPPTIIEPTPVLPTKAQTTTTAPTTTTSTTTTTTTTPRRTSTTTSTTTTKPPTPKSPFNYQGVETNLILRVILTKGNIKKNLHEFSPKPIRGSQREGYDLGYVVTEKGKRDMESGGADPAVIRELQPWYLYNCSETTRLVAGTLNAPPCDDHCKNIEHIGYGFKNPMNFAHVKGVWSIVRVDEFRGKRITPAINDWHYTPADRMQCAIEFWSCKTGAMSPLYDHTATIGHLIRDKRFIEPICNMTDSPLKPFACPPKPFSFNDVEKIEITRQGNETLHEFTHIAPRNALKKERSLGYVISENGKKYMEKNGAGPAIMEQLQPLYLFACERTTQIRLKNIADGKCRHLAFIGYGIKDRSQLPNVAGKVGLILAREFEGKTGTKTAGNWFYTSPSTALEWLSLTKGAMKPLYSPTATEFFLFNARISA